MPQPDDPRLLVVAEPDYRYGAGELRLRVIALLPDQDSRDGTWRGVAGTEIGWDGRELGSRTAAVRGSVLAEFLRRARATAPPTR